MKLSADAEKIVDGSVVPVRLKEVIAFTDEKTRAAGIQLTELQWTVFINHLNEMIIRSVNAEKMSGVDPTLFTEVSADSLQIAKDIVTMIGNLAEEETYVLSIHFESAKLTANTNQN